MKKVFFLALSLAVTNVFAANFIKHQSEELSSYPIKVSHTCTETYTQAGGSYTYQSKVLNCVKLKIWDNEYRPSKYLGRDVLVKSPVPNTEKIITVMKVQTVEGDRNPAPEIAKLNCLTTLKAIEETIIHSKCETEDILEIR